MSNNSISTTQEDIIYEGIDVSSYQGDIDFRSVKDSGIDVVYIKAGEGGNITDPNFERNYENARRAGLIVGFYYYVTALNPTQARIQAETFYDLIRGKDFQARPAMDYENFDGLERQDINEIGITFLDELEGLSGITPMIYSDAYSAESIWTERMRRYPLWLADYTNRDEFPQGITVWDTWTGFQYSDTGSVPGISGNVDMNSFKEGILFTDMENSAPSESTTTINYVIRPGDTLTSISQKFNVGMDVIAALNGIRNPSRIFAGQTLRIPQSSTVTGTIIYTVAPGDTLWEIARRFGTTVPAITSLNGIAEPDFLYIGQVLRIPSERDRRPGMR